MSTCHAKLGGTWREVQAAYGKHNGAWKPAKEIWAKSNGVWKQTWPNYLGFALVSEKPYAFCNSPGPTFQLRAPISRPPRSDEDRYIFYGISGGNIDTSNIKINGITATVAATEIDGFAGTKQTHTVVYVKDNSTETVQLNLAQDPNFTNTLGNVVFKAFVLYMPKGESPRVNVKKKAISLQAGGDMKGTATLITDHGLTTYLYNYFFGFAFRNYIPKDLSRFSITGASSLTKLEVCPSSLYGFASHSGQLYHMGYVQGSGKSGKTTAVIPSDTGDSSGSASFLFTVRVSSTKK